MKGNLYVLDRKQAIPQCVLKLRNKKAKCDNLLNKEILRAFAMKKKDKPCNHKGFLFKISLAENHKKQQ